MYHYPVHPLSQSVLAYIRKHELLRPGNRTGVAVSGGADSVALLRILLELRDELGLVLSVVHLNHCLRGEESDNDEYFVRELAAQHDLPLHGTRCDVKAHATKNKLSLETAARELRYRYFRDLLREAAFTKLATAHTLDDQAETVLLKLSRGAGTRGLAGIYPVVRFEQADRGDLAIIRPLLAVQRSDLEAYLAEFDQPWREDSTNRELHHTRNRIRHEILPTLIELLNPKLRQTLSDAAEIARAEEEFWSLETERQLPGVWSQTAAGRALNRSRLGELPLALQRRLVRVAADGLGLALDFVHVENVLALSREGDRTALPARWSACLRKGLIHFACVGATDNENYQYPLSVPGSVELPQVGLVVSASSVAADKQEGHNPDRVLDARFAENLTIRNWRAGDRFWPVNTKTPKKIKELLQDRHVTGEEKKRWPVIASGNEVVWLRGFAVRRDCRALNGTGILITEQPLISKD